ELAALDELEDQPVVAMPFGFVARPHQVPGHPEMEEQGGPVGPAHQPLPMAVRVVEPVAGESPLQHLDGGVPDDGGIGDDGGHRLARSVSAEGLAEVFDVWQFGHGASLYDSADRSERSGDARREGAVPAGAGTVRPACAPGPG